MTEAADPVTGEWKRVSGKYVWVQLAGSLVGGVVLAAIAVVAHLVFGAGRWWAFPWIVAVVVIIWLLSTVLTPRRVRSIRYRLREDDLLFRRGIMFRRTVAVPYGRMQLIDINRGPLDRWLGLAELKFVTAAASTGVTIPGLVEADSEALRDELVALAETRRAGL